MIRNDKGVTIITLVITIIVLLILSLAVIYSFEAEPDTRNLVRMRNDIELLRDRVLLYYNTHGRIPTRGGAIAVTIDTSSNRVGPYFEIDISRLANVTLNYGDGSRGDTDRYIINTTTLNIYYERGVVFENVRHHSIRQSRAIVREPESQREGVPIPRGFYFVGGTPETGVVISDNSDDEGTLENPRDSHDEARNLVGNQFVWVPVNNVQEYGALPPQDAPLLNIEIDEEDQIRIFRGFFVARYETGIEHGTFHVANLHQRNYSNPQHNIGMSHTPVSREGQVPWNAINYNNARIHAERMNIPDSVVSGLITARQWNSVIRWLGENPSPESPHSISSRGNFLGRYISGIRRYSRVFGSSWSNAAVGTTKPARYSWLLGTGTTAQTRMNNIYDFVGNLETWTTERSGNYRVLRGGSGEQQSNQALEILRSERITNATYIESLWHGFRVVLYIVEETPRIMTFDED